MKKRADVEEESKGNDHLNRKSWPNLEDEEESKVANVQMIMQPQDY